MPADEASATFLMHAATWAVVVTVVLTIGQAWVIGRTRRSARYVLVWATVIVLMSWLGMRVLGVRWNDPIMRDGPLRRSLVTVAAALTAASLGAGSAWIKWRNAETAPFGRRAATLAQAHLSAVLIGGALAYVLLEMVWMSQIH
jgi:FlaA1/EpsC-like NDP-sugar epimerase